MNCCKLVNLLAVLSAGTLHAESAFAAEAPGWEKEGTDFKLGDLTKA